MKDLITFGQAVGLMMLKCDTLEVHYAPPMYVQELPADRPPQENQDQDANTSGLPEELRHYSAQGKAAWGKVP